MTRKYVYYGALVAFAAATAMTATTNVLPSWMSYRASAPSGATYRQQIGLHRSCTSEFTSSSSPHHSRGWECHAFPTRDDCHGDERYFCNMWRSTGFLMAFALVAELASLVSFLVVLTGGKYMRETGWKVLSSLLGVVALVHVVALSIAAFLFNNDEKFQVPGWKLDTSWILCTVSAVIALLCGSGLALSAFILPPEDGYEFLEDPLGE